MSDTDDLGKRLLKLEIEQGVREKTLALEDRVRDMEAMIKTARYLLGVVGVLVTLIGIGVTAYVSSLTSKFDQANKLLDSSSKAIQRAETSANDTEVRTKVAHENAEKLLAQIKSAQGQSDDLRDTLNRLVAQATETVRTSTRDEVAKAIEVLLLPIQDRLKSENAKLAEQLHSVEHELEGRLGKTLSKVCHVWAPSYVNTIVPLGPDARPNACENIAVFLLDLQRSQMKDGKQNFRLGCAMSDGSIRFGGNFGSDPPPGNPCGW